MKIGSENRTKAIAAGALGLVAVVRVIFMIMPSGPGESPAAATSPAPVAASSLPSTSPAAKSSAKLMSTADMSLDPTLRLQLLHAVEGINYGGSGRNIFVEQPDAPPIPTVVTPVVADVPTGPPLPPPPPQIMLKFFGFANKAGEPKRVFLSQGDDVFIAAEGDIVNRRYKIVHINPNSVDIEDVLFNHTQSIPLTQS